MSAGNHFRALEDRLNTRGFVCWLKATQCLLMIKKCLHPFIDQRMKHFHEDLLDQNTQLREPCQTECKPKGKKFSPSCNECAEWKTVIMQHHRQPKTVVNWDNCDPPSWRKDHWEVAKAYMPRDLVNVKAAAQCDASALLYLINYCNCFQFVDQEVVTEVIKFRNDLMHSSEMNVTDEWLGRYQNSLEKLVQQFNDKPQAATLKQEIDNMLTVDLSISVYGVEKGSESDSDRKWDGINQSVAQWEELTLLLHDVLAAANDDLETRDAEQLKSLVQNLQSCSPASTLG